VWNLSKRRSFEVKTFYRALACQEAVSFPWKGIWRVKAPKRVAFFVWTTALGKILTHDTMPRSMLDLLSGWDTLLGRGHVTRLWKQVPLCVMWGLWRERNARLFEDVELPVVDLCRNVLNMLYVWVLAYSLSRIMFTEFLHSCSFVSSD
jgi:hypothetical protein